MARKIGEAFVRVRPDTAQFTRDATPGMAAAGHGVGSAFGGAFTKAFARVAIALGGILAARKAFGFLSEATEEQREAVRIGNLTNAVIKSTGGVAGVTRVQVEKLADSISAMVGVDDEAIQSVSNLLLTFTKVKNVGINKIFDEATQAAVDMTAALNKGVVTEDNLKSATLQVGKALNDPIKGITALRKAGVSFDEQQIKTIKHLVATGQTMEAQQIILGELKKEFGGAAAAAADPAKKAEVAWANVKEQIGSFTLPVVSRLATMFTDRVVPVINGQLIPGLRALGQAFQGEGVTSDGFVGAMERVGVKLRAVALFVRREILPALRDFGRWVQAEVLPRLVALWGYIEANILPILHDLVVRGIAGVRQGIRDLRASLASNREELTQLAHWLRVVADFIVQKVLPVVGPLFTNNIKTTVAMIKALISQIAFWVRVIDTVADATTRMVSTARERWDALVAFVRGLPGRITGAIGNLRSLLFNAGRDVVSGLWDGIVSLGPWLAGKITGWVRDHVPGPVRRVLELGSPSRLFARYGRDTVRGFAEGFTGESRRIEAVLAQAIRLAVPDQRAAAAAEPAPRTVQNTFNLVGPSVAELAAQVQRDIAWSTGV